MIQMKKYSLLLKDDTVGEIQTNKDLKVGDTACVEVADENGMLFFRCGKIKEILIEEDLGDFI